MLGSGAEDEDEAPPRKRAKYDPPNWPSQMVLCAHETINMNNKTKEFYTKPVTSGPRRNESNKNSENEENNQNFTNAKTEPVETNKETKSDTVNVKQMKRL